MGEEEDHDDEHALLLRGLEGEESLGRGEFRPFQLGCGSQISPEELQFPVSSSF